MTTDDLLRKLTPLMPDRVQRWRRALSVVDSTVRALLEHQIRTVAAKELGDLNQPHFSLPPRRKIGGAFNLGTVAYNGDRWPAGLLPSELVQNLAIFGRSGAGKTNLCFHLLQQLVDQGVPFLFLDWKRTARHLLPALSKPLRVYTPGRELLPFPFNPFLPPPGLERGAFANLVVDALADAYTLGDGARSLLQKVLAQEGRPTPATVLSRLRRIPDTERVRGWKVSAIRAVESLARVHTDTGASQDAMVQALTRESAILELDGLAPSGKAFLIPLLCLWVYYTMLAGTARERLRFVIVVEEAHHVLFDHRGTRESAMQMLLRQCRELGIGMVIIDQHPSKVSSVALGNTYTSICLNLKDATDIRKAAALSLVPAREAHHFSTLPTGHAIVKLQDRWHQPFLIRMPHVPVAKGSVTDGLLLRVVRGDLTLAGLKRHVQPVLAAQGRSRFQKTPLSEDGLALIDDILHHPSSGVDARYRRLGMSADRGHRLKQQLIRDGILEQEHVQIGRTQRTLVRVTRAAARDLGLRPRSDPRESLAHAYWKHWYARHFREQGYQTQIEAPRARGRVDVLATRGRVRIGIEVETGKSDVVANVKANLLSGFDSVLVVATDRAALVAVERALAEAGLIMPRVEVVLRSELRA